MTPLEHLIAARAKIEKPENWIQQHYAKTKTGAIVFGHDPKAVCFCSVGALQAVAGPDVETGLLLNMLTEYSRTNAIEYNDTHTHEEVLTMFDHAIELARAVEEGDK